MDKVLLRVIGQEHQLHIITAERVFGGDINETYILHTDGKKFFLKIHAADWPDIFEKERKGLDLLRSTHSIAAPEPIGTGGHGNHIYLLMEYMEKGMLVPDFWQVFGRQMAALHQHTAAQFGLDHDNYIGSLPQENKPADRWSEFYATRRLLFLIRRAYDEKKCDSGDTRMAERLCNKLDDLFPREAPSMLHGDLWSGNFMIGKQGLPVIYDPAVYYGHREMDIGMTLLFGGFDNSFYTFYNESWPLEKNWRQRVDLTQLYPLLVHLILFGGHYHHSVREVLKKYG